MMTSRLCPYCQQVLPEYRLGVRLGPVQARIFDLVRQGGEQGIDSDDLWEVTYNNNCPKGKGIREARNRETLKSHIRNINSELEDTGYRVINSAGCYRLVKK